MSMRTIYIRVQNEEFFDELDNKSETINSILDKLRLRKQQQEQGSEVEPSGA